MGNGKNLTIVVDNGERDSAVLKHLETKHIVLEYTNLRIGSYLLTNAVAVQRMTSDEFSKLTAEKLLFRRLLEFKKSYDEPLLLVEGANLQKNKTISAGAIRGAVSYASCLNRMPIVFTSDPKETAEYLFIMVNQLQFGLGFEVSVPEPVAVTAESGSLPKPKTPPEIQSYIVQALPDVGPSLARSIMQMYGTLRTLFSATAGDLTKVEGIGAKKAQKIVEVFDFEYNHD